MWATVVAVLCKLGTPICTQEIVADYSWQAVTMMQCQVQGQQGISEWMRQNPTYRTGWALKGYKCAAGPYTIPNNI
jgi:hypothetical protein